MRNAFGDVMLALSGEGFAHDKSILRRHFSDRNGTGRHDQRCLSVHEYEDMAPIFQEPFCHELELRKKGSLRQAIGVP